MKAALTVCPRPRRWPCATTRSACASARGAVARARAAGREGGEASRERAGAVIGANTTRRTMAPEESYSYVSSNDASMACGRCMVPRVIGAPRPHVATVSPVPSTTAPGKEGISAIRPSNQKQRARPRELRVTGRLERHLRACAVRGGGGGAPPCGMRDRCQPSSRRRRAAGRDPTCICGLAFEGKDACVVLLLLPRSRFAFAIHQPGIGSGGRRHGSSLQGSGPLFGSVMSSSSAIVSFILGLANTLTSSCAWRATCIEW